MEMFLPLILGLLLAVFIGRWAYKKKRPSPENNGCSSRCCFWILRTTDNRSVCYDSPEKEKTKEELVMAKLTRSLDGCPLDMKDRVKESMNDPDSFECIETNVIRRKDDYVMIMQFRGKTN